MNLPERLNMLLAIERQRYRLKGPTNTLIAASLLLVYTLALVTLGRRLWPNHIEDKANFILISSVSCAFTSYTLCFLIHLPGYLGHKAYKRYQINKSAPRPWQKEDWRETLTKTVKNVALNQFVVMPGVMWFTTRRGSLMRLEGFPSLEEMMSQLMFIYFMDDTLTYLFHRAFHEIPFLYKIHKVHHEHHSIFTWANIYAHPIELVFSNLSPTSLCALMLGSRMHCFTFLYWACYKAILSCEGHSGYEFPWSPFRVLPMVMSSRFHDYHHSNNVGTYGASCYFWDLITGTSDQFFKQFLACEPQKAKDD